MTGEQKAFLSFCCSVAVLQFSLSWAQLLAGLWQGNLPGLVLRGAGRVREPWNRGHESIAPPQKPKESKDSFQAYYVSRTTTEKQGEGKFFKINVIFG